MSKRREGVSLRPTQALLSLMLVLPWFVLAIVVSLHAHHFFPGEIVVDHPAVEPTEEGASGGLIKRKLSALQGNNYCQWTHNSSDCMKMLSERVLPSVGGENDSSNIRLAFFGDSTMHRLFRRVSQKMRSILEKSREECNCQLVEGKRCDTAESLGMNLTAEWKEPSESEGPAKYGRKHPRCHDCSGCNLQVPLCSLPCRFPTASFFPVQFARDVILQTTVANTTQENVVHHLMTTQQASKYPMVCIVNTGMHHLNLFPASSALAVEYFETHLPWYISKLRAPCGHLVWIQSTASLNEPGMGQQNEDIVKLNNISRRLLTTSPYMEWVTVVDPFELSTTWPHADNVHLDKHYYQELGSTFKQLVDAATLERK